MILRRCKAHVYHYAAQVDDAGRVKRWTESREQACEVADLREKIVAEYATRPHAGELEFLAKESGIANVWPPPPPKGDTAPEIAFQQPDGRRTKTAEVAAG